MTCDVRECTAIRTKLQIFIVPPLVVECSAEVSIGNIAVALISRGPNVSLVAVSQ